MQLDSQPEIIDRLERRQLQLEIEETALANEKDKMSKQRLDKVRKELSGVKEELKPLLLKHQAEQSRHEELRRIKNKVCLFVCSRILFVFHLSDYPSKFICILHIYIYPTKFICILHIYIYPTKFICILHIYIYPTKFYSTQLHLPMQSWDIHRLSYLLLSATKYQPPIHPPH